jgi:radical SAM protein with 4Fe4S-binding SPASM domain
MIEIKGRVGWRTFNGEIVVYNCTNHNFVVWNSTASKLWTLIDKKMDIPQLESYLQDNYCISERKSKDDVKTFIIEGKSLGLFESDMQVDHRIAECKESNGDDLVEIEIKAISKLIPFSVTFEATNTCNERCIHCYIEKKGKELTTSQIKEILKSLADEGSLFLTFTGGEFFFRKDAMEILEFASKMHFVIDILSNGVLINSSLSKRISKLPVRRIQVSLYGSNDKTHDYVTRTRNSFANTLKSIENLLSDNVKVEIAFILMNINFNERYEVKKLADALGCNLLMSHILTPKNNGSRKPLNYKINCDQTKEFLSDKSLSSLYYGRKPFEVHELYLKFANIMEAAPCYGGFNFCAISAIGKVLPCNQLLYELGDLNEKPFSEIWNNSEKLKILRKIKIKDLIHCSSCELLRSCARCPGLALLEKDNLLDISPISCEITTIKNNIN